MLNMSDTVLNPGDTKKHKIPISALKTSALS